MLVSLLPILQPEKATRVPVRAAAVGPSAAFGPSLNGSSAIDKAPSVLSSADGDAFVYKEQG